MSKSMQEEINAAIWMIASIMCFGFGFNKTGWILAVKVFFDLVAVLWFSGKELKSWPSGK